MSLLHELMGATERIAELEAENERITKNFECYERSLMDIREALGLSVEDEHEYVLDEIRRLRREVGEALSAAGSEAAYADELRAEVERLRRERDDARAGVCWTLRGGDGEAVKTHDAYIAELEAEVERLRRVAANNEAAAMQHIAGLNRKIARLEDAAQLRKDPTQ